MFELYSTGNYSLNALMETMYKEGLRSGSGKKICKSRIHEHLSNPYFYGKMRWMGEIYQGKHEPIISKELFDVVQKRLTRKNENPQYKTHLPIFKAKIKCDECGGTITWELQKGHWYGHCNHYKECSQTKWMKQYEVENQLFPLFNEVAPKNERVLSWLIKAMKESHVNEIDYNNQKRESLSRIIRTTDQRIEQAYRDKLDGKMPTALCEKIMQESTKEKEDAIDTLEKLSKSRTAYYEAGYAIHELALKASAIYQNPKAKTEDKRLLLSYIFSNLALNADKISPNYTFAFEFMLKFMPMLNEAFELADFGSNKAKEGISASLCPVLCARQDSNLQPLGSKPSTLSVELRAHCV
ncbi:MAG: Resolvase [Candidatus Moranbacteria bacterium GW2011_GWE2_36_40]|nr:MAG: Resolvase [Candidatus Moranbacteria bacterium GW2011_GWE2_36_40]